MRSMMRPSSGSSARTRKSSVRQKKTSAEEIALVSGAWPRDLLIYCTLVIGRYSGRRNVAMKIAVRELRTINVPKGRSGSDPGTVYAAMSACMKRRLICTLAGALFLGLAVAVPIVLRPRYFYRFQAGTISLRPQNEAWCWNGLRTGPCLEFRIPFFSRPNSWKPHPNDIRTALAESPYHLTEEEIAWTIKSCVTYDEYCPTHGKIGSRSN